MFLKKKYFYAFIKMDFILKWSQSPVLGFHKPIKYFPKPGKPV